MRRKLREYHTYTFLTLISNSHVQDNPHTLLSRIFGLHRVKLPGNKKIHFVVMGNIFPPHKDIHRIYDLKGSTSGRFLSQKKQNASSMPVLKDKNWLKNGEKLKLGPEKVGLIVDQMEKDVKFLQENSIMDYSFLVGIHSLHRGNKEMMREKSLIAMDVSLSMINCA
jgi:1-phosphatidylinositol-4-phosphate 5-kinase